MATNELDTDARMQLLLTRMALDRVQWAHDLEAVRSAAHPKNLLSSAFRSVMPDGLRGSLFGSSGSAGSHRGGASLSSRAMQLFLLARRYPLITSLVGTALPWFRARRALRRVLMLGTVGAAVAGGLWLAGSSRSRR